MAGADQRRRLVSVVLWSGKCILLVLRWQVDEGRLGVVQRLRAHGVPAAGGGDRHPAMGAVGDELRHLPAVPRNADLAHRGGGQSGVDVVDLDAAARRALAVKLHVDNFARNET